MPPPSARTRSPASLVAVAAGGAALAAALLAAHVATRGARVPEPEVENRPIALRDGGYVSSQACRACHPREYDSWYASYHRTMTQVARPDTVLGRFDGHVRHGRERYRLGRAGDAFWVEFERGADGRVAPERRQVVLTTGSHHHQYYWMEGEGDRGLSLLSAAWLIPDRRWVPIADLLLQPPTYEPQPQVGEWNANCSHCHSTRPQPRWSEAGFDTRVAEMGIACESCHGPGGEHVRRNRDPRRRYEHHLSGEADPTIVQPEQLPHRRASEVCGQCHSALHRDSSQQVAWIREGRLYRPGESLERDVLIVRGADDPEMREVVRGNPYYIDGLFWSDGMVRIAGREYNGLLTSPCYQRGELTCLSCHAMHPEPGDPRPLGAWADDQLAPGMRGDAACLQCHSSFAARVTEHSHHPAGSTGAECQNCHTPHTAYGMRKAIRSHQISSPSVVESLETGRPNACNLCHLDRTLAWTDEWLGRWYGIPPAPLGPDDRAVAAGARWLLAGDAGQRALVAWHMGWEPAREASGSSRWMRPFLAQLLDDPYAAVRYVAYRSLRSTEGFEDFAFDFIAAPPQRARARVRAFARWEGLRGAADGAAGPQTLLDADGALRGSEFAGWLRRRDDRFVLLQE